MKRGVILLIVLSLMLIPNAYSKGVKICDSNNLLCVNEYRFDCSTDKVKIEQIMGQGWCGQPQQQTPPPNSRMTARCSGDWCLGNAGENCNTVCSRQSKTCVQTKFREVNACSFFSPFGSCNCDARSWWAADQPAYVSDPNDGNFDKCLGYTGNTAGASCEASYSTVMRLCPCTTPPSPSSWQDAAKKACESRLGSCTDYPQWKRYGIAPIGEHYYYDYHDDGCSSGSAGQIKEECSGCNEPSRGDFNINGNILSYSGDCVIPPPVCQPNQGQACISQPNNCGQTNPGTYDCNGVCSATTPPNKPEICGNGIDDDCDGKTDCADTDCVPSSPVPTGGCCAGNSAVCSLNDACENNICKIPSKIGKSTCCLTHTECISIADQNKNNPLKWPQPGDCAEHGTTEKPECY